MALARVGQHQFSRPEAKASESLNCARAAGRGKIEVVALQAGQQKDYPTPESVKPLS
jgi:hypothetical protein